MAWYRPRLLTDLKDSAPADFDPQIASLPIATPPLFNIENAKPGGDIIKDMVPFQGQSLTDYSHHRPYPAKIISSTILTGSDAVKPVYSVKLDVKELSDWHWGPGDAFGILPENDPEITQYALDRLGLNPSEQLRLTAIGKPGRESLAEFWTTIDTSVSLANLFSKHIDWSYYPKKACLAQLAQSCSDPSETRDLLYLASKDGSALYLKAAGERTTILDFLNTFKSCQPSLELLLRHLPLLHPRYYSICSAREQDPGSIEFVFSSMDYSTACGAPRRGICTSWILGQVNRRLTVNLVPRPSSTIFRAPSKPDHPMIMVCAGTGVAPFIGFLRHYHIQTISTNSWLFYGFRSIQYEYLFKEELNGFLQSKALGQLTIAVSREPELGHPKYVQHALKEHINAVWELMTAEPPARMYLCGEELSMVKEVNDLLLATISERLGITPKEALVISQQWSKEGRIVRDIWV